MPSSSNTLIPMTFSGATIDQLRNELNRAWGLLRNVVDQQAGIRGEPNFNGTRIRNVGTPQSDTDAEQHGLSLSALALNSPFDARNKTINHVSQPTEAHQAVNLGLLEERLGSVAGKLTVSGALPSIIDAGDAGIAGGGTAVSSAVHEHPVNTAGAPDILPVGLLSGAGASPKLPRADHVHAGFDVLALSGADVIVSGTTAETVVYSVVLPAGVLGTSAFLRLTSFYLVTSAGGTTIVRLKLGASTVFAAVHTDAVATQRRLEWLVFPYNGPTNQKHYLTLHSSGAYGGLFHTISAENTAGNLAVTVTVQPASAGDQIHFQSAVAEIGQ